MLSGYKACSRRFVKSFPILSGGFEIETELMVHALELNVSAVEITGTYDVRPPGSTSKLGTLADGTHILRAIVGLTRHTRPLAFFSVLAAALALLGIGLGIPLLFTFLQTHEVPRLPTAVLATGLETLAALALTAGLVLDTVARGRREQRLLALLAIPGPLAAAGAELETTGQVNRGSASITPKMTTGASAAPGLVAPVRAVAPSERSVAG